MSELVTINGFSKIFVELKNWKDFDIINNFVDSSTNKGDFKIGIKVGRATKEEKKGWEICIPFDVFCKAQRISQKIELTRFNSNAHEVIQQRDELIKDFVRIVQCFEWSKIKYCSGGRSIPSCPICRSLKNKHSDSCSLGNALQKAKEFFEMMQRIIPLMTIAALASMGGNYCGPSGLNSHKSIDHKAIKKVKANRAKNKQAAKSRRKNK
jgi:hypothetical protein